MLPIRMDVSHDTTRLMLAVGGEETELTAEGVERLILHLTECRARMSPVHQTTAPGDDEAEPGERWRIQAAPDRTTLILETRQPGGGRSSMRLSRAEAEDMVTGIALALVKISESR